VDNMNRKKNNFDNFWNFGFDDFFSGFDDQIKALINDVSSEYTENGPITYGYSINIGPDTNYKPEVRQWGNLNDYRKKQGLPELTPFEGGNEGLYLPSNSDDSSVEVIEDTDSLKVLVEVPGFEKNQLSIEVDETGTEITITGNNNSKKINKNIKLASKIEPNSLKSSIKNGVLEIYSKKNSNQQKKFKVKID